jgi:hypothetical protein
LSRCGLSEPSVERRSLLPRGRRPFHCSPLYRGAKNHVLHQRVPCQARERLPEKFFADVARSVGRALDAKADPRWLTRTGSASVRR